MLEVLLNLTLNPLCLALLLTIHPIVVLLDVKIRLPVPPVLVPLLLGLEHMSAFPLYLLPQPLPFRFLTQCPHLLNFLLMLVLYLLNRLSFSHRLPRQLLRS